MATYNDTIVSNTWIDVLSLLSITVDDLPIRIQNKGSKQLLINFQSDAPTTDEGSFIEAEEYLDVSDLVEGVWIKAATSSTTYKSAVGFEDLRNINRAIPSDIFTNNIFGIRRISVDPQQTSFEANQQFRFVDEFEAVDDGTAILYLFTLTTSLNLFERTLNLITGGRKYYVYPYNSSDTYTGSATSGWSRIPTPMNNYLRDGLSSHPATTVTVARYDVTAFTPTENWVDITMVNTDSNTNRATSAFSSDGLRFGSGTNTQFWVYMPALSQNTNATNGYLRLVWEERTEL